VEAQAANLLRAQAGYYALTGIWPFVDLRTFQMFTGPKASPWLVKTVGALVTVIGAALMSAQRAERVAPEIKLLSIGSAAALSVIDTRYALAGRISKAYLVDAAAQALVLVGWVRLARAGVSKAVFDFVP